MFLKSQPCGEKQADARGAWAHQPRLPVEFQASGGPCLPATVLSRSVSLSHSAALSHSTSSRAPRSSAGCLPRILVREEDRKDWKTWSSGHKVSPVPSHSDA